VVANGGVAAAAALLGSWPALAGALAAATADTWATEIGSLSRHAPRSITTWAKVARGTSGGITLPGTVGGVVGAAGIGTLAWLLGPRGAASAPEAAAVGTAVAVAGVLGMVLDSVLGATLQGEFECGACGARSERRGALCHGPVTRIKGYAWVDNDWVNLAATFSGALIALWLS
jgi:uncharacterized protein (TIGR00297 family)